MSVTTFKIILIISNVLLAVSLLLQSIILYKHIADFDDKVHAALLDIEFEVVE